MTVETVQTEISTPAVPPARRRSGPLRRLGCGAALVLWFLLLLTPCGLLTLAVNGEIAISQGELPGQQLRIWLIMEPDERGVGISTTSTSGADGTNICLQTDTRFVLWQGRADPLRYCECFTRAAAQDEWGYSQMAEGACAS